MKILLAFLLLSSVSFAQQGYVVQRFGGQIVIVPNGPIKNGPRNYSQFDPANPYRYNTFDYAGRNGLGMTQAQVTPVAAPACEVKTPPKVYPTTPVVIPTPSPHYKSLGNGFGIMTNPFVDQK